MKTISIINMKGGVAKTTTAVSMAELLAEGDKRRKRSGYRVLLLDNDKQGNASRLFGVYDREKEAEACRIIKTGHMDGNILRTKNENMVIIPCNYYMELAELEIKADQNHAQHDRYRMALDEVSGQYDYCIIDNPPDLGMNVINAMAASDEIIIPVKLDSYSLDGLIELTDQVNQIKMLNQKAVIAGILIVDHEKSDTSDAAEIWLRTASGCPVFEHKIRHSRKVKDSTFYQQTPIRYSVRSGAAQDYKAFADEYIRKFGKERG